MYLGISRRRVILKFIVLDCNGKAVGLVFAIRFAGAGDDGNIRS